MNRRVFMGALVGGLLAAPLAAEAQKAGKVPRVGLLGLGSAESSSPFFEALRQGLRERGWVEGQNIAFEDRTRVGRGRYVIRCRDVLRLDSMAADLLAGLGHGVTALFLSLGVRAVMPDGGA